MKSDFENLRLAIQSYIQRAADARGWTLSKLAKEARVAPSTVNKFMKNQTPNIPSTRTLVKIQRASGVQLPVTIAQKDVENVGTISQAYDRSASPSPTRKTLDGLPGALPATFGDRDLPVLGRAQGGVGVVKIATDERPVDWTFRPADLVGVSEAYAIYVVDDSMSPIYEHGDLVYVHPGWPVRAGKVVVVQLDDDTAIIKVYVSQSDKEIRLRSADPKRAHIIYPRAQVRAVHRVIGGIESR